jgi:uncharacterized protein YndB with AHSA1/START domain
VTINFKCGVDIACPPERVFQLLDDVSQAPRWLPSCQAMEKVTPGPNAIGTELRFTYQDSMHASVMMGSITDRIVNRELSFEYSDRLVSVAAQFRLTERVNGTHLLHQIEITPKTFLVRMISPLIHNQLAIRTRTALENLQRLLENEVPQETEG